MNWLAFVFALEIGVQPFGDFRAYEPLTYVQNAWTPYQKLEARVYLWDMIFAGGLVELYEWPNKDLSFWPERTNLQVNAGFRWRFIEIGWRHSCIYPIIPRFDIPIENRRWQGGYEEIYLRLEGKIGGRK